MKRDDIISYLKGEDDFRLFAQAQSILFQHCGRKVIIRGLIEFSSYCCRNCLYCGLRRDNIGLKRYRLKHQEIINQVRTVGKEGINTVVLQSGDDFYYTRDMVVRLITEIKKEFPNMAVTLSLGERDNNDYKAFKDSGADRYLLKHETISDELYSFLHPGQSLKRRLEILNYLKKLDYQVGIGNIIGLPFQSIDQLADDLIFIRDFNPDMIGIGPFISQKNTPLSEYVSPDMGTILRFYALTRIISLNAHIPATTAVGTFDKTKGCQLALCVGANVLMANFTPNYYHSNFLIYDNKNAMSYSRCCEIIADVNREVCLQRGDSLKNPFIKKGSLLQTA